ncbi:MAG: GntR family histidine utilization transcriptional repressor [Alphaproteobacteria bacterium]|jgi:GntR family histidine utilization transcriptional repressor
MKLSRFVVIKSALLDLIESGQMKPGDKVASENKLAEQFSVSRMTSRRAITELVTEGILFRSQGLGTFVSDSRPMSSILNIRSIDEEILQRGHRYSNQVISVQSVSAGEEQSAWLGVNLGTSVFKTQIVHLENDLAVQLEYRLVNPKWAPEYLEQDFHLSTTSRYLTHVAPLTEADHVVEAVVVSQEIATLLQIEQSQPCLKISRRTFSANGVVSFAQLYHPGNRYRIGGHLDF